MSDGSEKKTAQLGMPYGTASHKLRKIIIFSLVVKLGENFCFRCGKKIESEKDLSIEHKTPWLDSENPTELFFDLQNIAFSHLGRNSGSARYTGEPAKMYELKCDGCGEAYQVRGAQVDYWRRKGQKLNFCSSKCAGHFSYMGHETVKHN